MSANLTIRHQNQHNKSVHENARTPRRLRAPLRAAQSRQSAHHRTPHLGGRERGSLACRCAASDWADPARRPQSAIVTQRDRYSGARATCRIFATAVTVGGLGNRMPINQLWAVCFAGLAVPVTASRVVARASLASARYDTRQSLRKTVRLSVVHQVQMPLLDEPLSVRRGQPGPAQARPRRRAASCTAVTRRRSRSHRPRPVPQCPGQPPGAAARVDDQIGVDLTAAHLDPGGASPLAGHLIDMSRAQPHPGLGLGG